MHPIFERLKERKIVQWALAYVAGAVALYSALDAFADPWGVGDVQLRTAQVLLLVGFLLALTLAWYHGERGEQRVTGVELLILAGIMGLGAIGIRLVTAGLPVPSSVATTATVAHLRLPRLGERHPPLRDFELGPVGTGYYYVDDQATLWYRPWDGLQETRLPRTGAATRMSPDGRTVVLAAGGGIELLPLDGGGPTRLVERGVISAPHWGGDGFLYYQSEDGTIRRVREAGGAAERLGIELQEGEVAHTDYHPIRPGVGLFSVRTADGAWRIDAHDLNTGSRRTLTEGTNPTPTSTGHLVYGSGDGRLLAATFDARTLSIGPPQVMATNVATQDDGRMNWSLSSDGILAYWEAAHDLHELVWVSRDGVVTPLEAIGGFYGGGLQNRYWALSPDERRVAVALGGGVDRDIWVLNIADGSRTNLTPWLGEDRAPLWLSDSTLAFLSERSGSGQRDLWSRRADAVDEPALIYDHFDNLSNALVGEDGWLVLRTSGGSIYGNAAILAVDPATGTEPSVIEGGQELWASNPALSPDGQWLAYNSEVPTTDGSESWDVFVRPFPSSDSRVVISDARGGQAPVWSHDGRDLFYVTDDSTMVAASVETHPSFRVVARRDLFRVEEGLQWSVVSQPSVRADGTFLFMRARERTEARVVLVFGFFEELERRLLK